MKRSLILISYTLWLINKKITSKIIQSHFIYKKEIASLQPKYSSNHKSCRSFKDGLDTKMVNLSSIAGSRLVWVIYFYELKE